MATVTVKIIHPTNNSDIDIALRNDILLEDVFKQLSMCHCAMCLIKDLENFFKDLNLSDWETLKEAELVRKLPLFF